MSTDSAMDYWVQVNWSASLRRGLLKHVSNYSLGSLLIMLAGFVSFPILTRVLSVSEYGLLALVMTTLGFLVAVGKMGLQHSTMMCYSDTAEGKNDWGIESFYSTVVYGMASVSFVIMCVWILFSYFFSEMIWGEASIRTIFLVCAPLVVIRAVNSALSNILKAQERSGVVTFISVVQRWGSLVLVIGGLLLIEPSLVVFFVATLLAELVVLVALFILIGKTIRSPASGFSKKIFVSMFMIGLPMFGYELAGIFVNLGDRYVISVMLGTEELGKYAAAYNLCEYASTVIILSLQMAVLPMYLRMWAQEGREPTKRFIERALGYYILLAFPLAVGFSIVGPDLIKLLASEKYVEGAVIMPYVMAGKVVEGVIIMLAAGLYIQKKTKILMLLLGSAALGNLLLNIVLVPRLGIEGAAVATTVTYVFYAVLSYVVASKTLKIVIPLKKVLVAFVSLLVMYQVISFISIDSLVLSVIIKVLAGVGAYGVAILLLDAHIRDSFVVFFSKRPNSRANDDV